MGVTLAPLALLLTVALAAAGAADPGSNASDEIGALACASIHPAVVVYNRVPKAASSTMLALLHAQHIKGLLTWVHCTNYTDRAWWGPKQEAENLQRITHAIAAAARRRRREGQVAPVVYDQHMRYLNLTNEVQGIFSGLLPSGNTTANPGIAYINILRDPVDRAVSSYYYAMSRERSPEGLRRALQRRGNQSHLNIDECLQIPVEQRLCGFNGDENLMTSFFCGHGGVCECVGNRARPCPQAARRAALARAKDVLLRSYTLVGLQSRMADFLKLLQRLLPGPFAGVVDEPIPYERRTSYSKPLPATRAAILAVLDLDSELYDFAARVFEARYNACMADR
eukprot:m.92209 g.92209  ORF g.92209 m.92209 type:complete len:340 (+) comp8503_c0_seq5:89-1108(+)